MKKPRGRPRGQRRPRYNSHRAVPAMRHRVGQRLLDFRRSSQLTQERLGRACGLSGKFIGEVERGEKSISVDSLYRVSRALRVSMRRFL